MVGILDKPFLLGGFGLFQGLYTLVSGRVLRVFFFRWFVSVLCFFGCVGISHCLEKQHFMKNLFNVGK